MPSSACKNYPDINTRGDVAWYGVDEKDNDYEIYLYDASTGAIRQLTDNRTSEYDPQISDNGSVAWLGFDGQDDEIYLYNSATREIKQLTINSTYDYSPRIN